MRNFGSEFGGTLNGQEDVHSTVDLGRTFRSVDKIALPARSFVLQNPSQIEKQVIPFGKTDEPSIKVAYYGRRGEEQALRSALDSIGSALKSEKASVLLLGRYRFLEPDNLARLGSKHPRLSIRFMTVHGSKGLEADHVIILSAATNRMGFPSEIVDDPLLDLVLPEPEKFDHAEERRLFYVALTRARKSVIVLADREKPSVFARELVEIPEYGVIEFGAAEIAEQRCGACGGRMLAQTSKKGRLYYQCEHRYLYGEMLRPCSECRKDLPAAVKSDPKTLICSCGASFPTCPECSDGWLVERRSKWGGFLSCAKYPECNGKRSLSNEQKKPRRKKRS